MVCCCGLLFVLGIFGGRGGMRMDKNKLQAAINEAHRFIKAAVEAKAIMEGKPVRFYMKYNHNISNYEKTPVLYEGYGYGPANASARRASMDLTRALAKMRKY
jgi:hypothetical protein